MTRVVIGRWSHTTHERVLLDYVEEGNSAPLVMPDIQPYKSMIDGSTIGSRSYHRDHLKAHGCIEVGNEKMESKPVQAKSERRDILRRQLSGMTDSQASRILNELHNRSKG